MTERLSSVNNFSGRIFHPNGVSFSGMGTSVDPERVAGRLRAVMADLELDTVGELAAYLGAERSQVSNWLQGYNLPPARWMDVLCRKRPGLTLDWLYRGVADGLPRSLAIKLEALAAGMSVPMAPQGSAARTEYQEASPHAGRKLKRKRAT